MKKKIFTAVLALAMVFSMTTMSFGASKAETTQPSPDFNVSFQGNTTVIKSDTIWFQGYLLTQVKSVKVNDTQLSKGKTPGWDTRFFDFNRLYLKGVVLKPGDTLTVVMKNNQVYRFTYIKYITILTTGQNGFPGKGTTYLEFELSEPIEGLTLEDINFTDDFGPLAFEPVDLYQLGNTYAIALDNVTRDGEAAMSIVKKGYKVNPEPVLFQIFCNSEVGF